MIGHKQCDGTTCITPQHFFRNHLAAPPLREILRSHDAQFPWWRALQAAPDLGHMVFLARKGRVRYPLVIKHSYWKWPFLVYFPIEHCDFTEFC